MKAIQQKSEQADSLYIGEYKKPQLKPNEVLVKVEAFAINRADILQRKGKYPAPKGASPLMGLELSGLVEDAGQSSKWKVGDKVFGLVPSGAYAEYAAVDADLLMPMPASMSFEEAAAIPEVFLTAYLGLVCIGELKAGETALIHGAAGGVGTAALQIAKQMNCKVIATAKESKHAICKALGADICIDYSKEAWAESVGENSVDVVLDMVGAKYFQDNIKVMTMDGRMCMIALIGGGDVEQANLRPIIGKRLKIQGSTLRNRSIEFQRALNKSMFDFAYPLFENGRMKPVIDCIMPWIDIAKAHQRMEAGEHVGKIVMRVGG